MTWRFIPNGNETRGVVKAPWGSVRLARFITPEQAKVEAKLRGRDAA